MFCLIQFDVNGGCCSSQCDGEARMNETYFFSTENEMLDYFLTRFGADQLKPKHQHKVQAFTEFFKKHMNRGFSEEVFCEDCGFILIYGDQKGLKKSFPKLKLSSFDRLPNELNFKKEEEAEEFEDE